MPKEEGVIREEKSLIRRETRRPSRMNVRRRGMKAFSRSLMAFRLEEAPRPREEHAPSSRMRSPKSGFAMLDGGLQPSVVSLQSDLTVIQV
jgi:hypothetical protein